MHLLTWASHNPFLAFALTWVIGATLVRVAQAVFSRGE